ncbi:MAG: type II secretion system protein GspD, partial [Planctomycetaceae bacterium]
QIQVGQQVPVVRGVTVNNLGGTNPVVQPEDVGIILAVVPRITPDGMIVMEVIATRSSVSEVGVPIFTDITTGNVVESPIINISTAEATVRIANGQTIVLGGMITKSDDTLERKVPWFGDIPYLGAAFRYDSTRTRRTELLIFLTPRIIYSDADSELIKQVEAERIHFIEQEAEALHGPLFATPPLFPPRQPPVLMGDPMYCPEDDYGFPEMPGEDSFPPDQEMYVPEGFPPPVPRVPGLDVPPLPDGGFIPPGGAVPPPVPLGPPVGPPLGPPLGPPFGPPFGPGADAGVPTTIMDAAAVRYHEVPTVRHGDFQTERDGRSHAGRVRIYEAYRRER